MTRSLDNRNVKRFFKNMKGRMSAVQSSVIRELAQDFSEEINLVADSYSAGVYQNESGCVVKVDEVIHKVAESSEFAVYLYQPMNLIGESSPFWNVLKLYQPFVSDFVPLMPDLNIRLVSRDVSEEEFLYVQDKNSQETGIISSYLNQYDEISNRRLNVGELPVETQVTKDLVWSVLRQEQGIRTQRVPVWLPAIRSFRKAKALRDLMRSGKFDRVLVDADFSRLIVQMESDSIPEKEYDRFQKVILKI